MALPNLKVSQYFHEKRRYFMIMLMTIYTLDPPFLQGDAFPFGYIRSYDSGMCGWEETGARDAVKLWRLS
jgi:hypothetical protein